MAFCFAVRHFPCLWLCHFNSRNLWDFCRSKILFFPSLSSLKCTFAVLNISQKIQSFVLQFWTYSNKKWTTWRTNLFLYIPISSSQPPLPLPSSYPLPLHLHLHLHLQYQLVSNLLQLPFHQNQEPPIFQPFLSHQSQDLQHFQHFLFIHSGHQRTCIPWDSNNCHSRFFRSVCAPYAGSLWHLVTSLFQLKIWIQVESSEAVEEEAVVAVAAVI